MKVHMCPAPCIGENCPESRLDDEDNVICCFSLGGFRCDEAERELDFETKDSAQQYEERHPEAWWM